MSKLAALAAARKKKESERNKAEKETTDAEPSPSLSSPKTQPSTSISLLDRLASNGRHKASPESRLSRFPLRKPVRGPSPGPQKKPSLEIREPMESDQKPKFPVKAPGPSPKGDSVPLTEDLLARPSSFATVIVGSRSGQGSSYCSWRGFDMLKLYGQGFTECFNFAEPSPDDVVFNAQNAAKANKAKQAKAQSSAKATSDLADNVKQLSVQESVKPKSKQLDVLEEHRKTKRKKAANFVVIGHVDAGKSTLMGRLLYDLKAIDQRTVDKYKREADKIGKGSFHLAWVLDQGSEERARGVTIDIATNRFETDSTSFTILDAPGHRDFVPNMIAGASQADFAVLVIDASTGNFESGLKGQTKEHALLVRSMGVQKMVVAVNKMDSVHWSKERFDEIEQQISSFLTTAGFQPKNISFVPCSGLRGENIISRTKDKNAAWYSGRTLIEELETAEPYAYAIEKPLRMTIADVFKGGAQNQLSISGRIDAGSLQVGDRVLSMPSGEAATIKSLEIDQEPKDWAVAGNNVVLHLVDIDPMHLKTGDVICSPSSPVQNISSFTAKVLAFDHLTPMHVELHRGRLHVPGRISRLVATLDKASGTPVKKKPKIVAPGMVARIVVDIDQPIPLEAPARVVLRASGETVAAGLLE
ncbi:Hsp70 suppressor, GTPase facilitates ribosomal subunit dissociation, variant 2 [Coccidioides posadasii str. Silveira]|uniref:Elongation factor 1 alpha-like protein n=1 Tax=Coccidioides posadasii (strain RMSCC 757 / Silveira) TaxID=443226 RepID=E9CWZ2_COCPS|nr:elongation factor Tu [Coccidioides posadasii str. Silveira]QVM07236.1 Hsp70 suppressor, GTPase facilitates ribosomal subunit dissociation, variant 2 [Coccidioides posadasii str. Silveira]